MSYAGRLVAMSRGALAPVATESVHEERVEAEAPAATAARAPNATNTTTTALPVSRPVREPHRDDPARAAAPSQVVEHRETVVERIRDVPGPAIAESPAPSAPAAHTIERVVMPAPPGWLAEDPSAPDPLVASADTDALRDLLRSVRQWTSSEPTNLAPELVAKHLVRPTDAMPADPVQVSIGNVVITVEDAPAPSPRRGTHTAPVRTSSDRLARNHIRGT